MFWVLTFKCMLLYRKCCHYKCWQNANRKTEWETSVCEQQKGRAKSREKTSEATVIVNIVIVIGSNNHILISCVYGFGSTLTLCLRDYKHNGAFARMFSSKVGMFTLNQCVSVCECTISKQKIRNSNRPKATVPLSYGRCHPVIKCVLVTKLLSLCVWVCVCFVS